MVLRAEAGRDGVPLGKAAGDIELLRQHLIVQLLRQLPMERERRLETFRQLLRCGVLTGEVLGEALSEPSGLCAYGVDAAPAVLWPAAGAVVLGGAAPCVWDGGSPAGGRPAHRFELEFERLEPLGRGAFGEVWRCRHRLDGREYAVKTVRYRAGAAEADRIEARVVREAQTWAAMDHPNVARYHSAWVEVDWLPCGPPGEEQREPGRLVLLPPEPGGHLQRKQQLAQVEPNTSLTFEEESDCGVTFQEASGNNAEAAAASAALASPRGGERPVAATELVARRSAFAGSGDGGSPAGRLPPRRGSAGCFGGGCYWATLHIQTELCSKETLAAWLARRNAACAAAGGALLGNRRRWALEACAIFQQCLAAVAHLHARRCVHRDLKPSNVLFARDGTVRLCDFGLAKAVDAAVPLEAAASGETATPAVPGALWQHTRGVGTPAYASPEQLAGGACGLPADIFALGVMFVELLTPVHTQMERAALLEGLRSGHRAPEVLDGSFPVTARLVAGMTHPDPARRPMAEEVLRRFPDVVNEVQQHFSSNALTDLPPDDSSTSWAK